MGNMRRRLPATVIVGVAVLVCAALLASRCGPSPAQRTSAFDVVIKGGTVYDGSGGAPVRADVGIRGDQIAAVGDLSPAGAAHVIDASALAVAPGFINMLSWSTESLLVDG